MSSDCESTDAPHGRPRKGMGVLCLLLLTALLCLYTGYMYDILELRGPIDAPPWRPITLRSHRHPVVAAENETLPFPPELLVAPELTPFGARTPAHRRLEELPFADDVARRLAGLEATGDWPKLRDKALAVVRNRPGHLQARFRLARALERLGEATSALRQLDFLVERAPGFRRGHLLRGRALFTLGRYGESALALERAGAIRLDPEVERLLGVSLLLAGKPGEARPYLVRAVKAANRAPAGGAAYYALACSCARLGARVVSCVDLLRMAARDRRLFRHWFSKRTLGQDPLLKPRPGSVWLDEYVRRLPSDVLAKPPIHPLLRSQPD